MLGFSVLAGLSMATASLASLAPRQLGQPIWGGVNITAEVLRVQGAISRPVCNATQACISFVAWVPSCFKVNGDPACWCPTPDPLHYCALCMSNPRDNTTTPQQTGDATAGHANYHTGCNAYYAFINGTLPSESYSHSATSTSSAVQTPTALPASTSSSMSTGSLVGAIVGGIIGLILVAAGAFLIYRHMQNKHEERIAAARHSFYPSEYDIKTAGTSPRLMPVSPQGQGMHQQPGMGMMGFVPYGGMGPTTDAPQVMTPTPHYSMSQGNRESMMSGPDARGGADQR